MKRRTATAINGPKFSVCRHSRQATGFRLPLSALLLAVTWLLCGDGHASQAPEAEAVHAQPKPGPAAPLTQAEQPPSNVDVTALKQFVHDYWRQRFVQHAERVNWRDYQWQIEVTVPKAVSKLPPCLQPYQPEAGLVNLPVGRQRLRLRCPDKPGWLITARSEISVLMPVVVTRTALDPEHYLQAADLAVTQILLTAQQADVLIDPAQAIGRRPQRGLRAGQPVRNKMLEAALLVRKGDKVRLTLAEGGMSISMEGTALQDGQKGEIISIKNDRGGKIVSAEISGPGQLIISNTAPPMDN